MIREWMLEVVPEAMAAAGHDVARFVYPLPPVDPTPIVDLPSPTYERELASTFHSFYDHCPVLRSDVDPDLQQARLSPVEASRIGLAIGPDLLGINAPEHM